MPSSQKSKPTRKRRTPRPKARARKPKRLAPADFADSKSIIEIQERPSSIKSADALDFDSGLWGRARTQWMLGDWDSLASLELGHLEQAPHRAELAALSACAQLQKGDKQSARKSLAAASRWNCAPAFMVRALVAGSEASMARYHEICGRDDKSLQLLASSAGALGGDGSLAAEVRKLMRNPETVSNSQKKPAWGSPLQSPSDTNQTGHSSSIAKKVAEAQSVTQSAYPPEFFSYAQNLEDVVLWRALRQVDHGFYVDIGAHHPHIDSINKAFYDRGWSGLHVDASPQYASLLRQERPPDSVLEAAASDDHGTISFYELPDTGISTGRPEIAAMHQANGFTPILRRVPAITVDDILSYAVSRGASDIHWMSIDVEGMEHQAIKGWKSHDLPRPWIVLVESTVPCTQVSTHEMWEVGLLAKNYTFAYYDGLSRFYVANEHADLIATLALPPNTFDNFVIAAKN